MPDYIRILNAAVAAMTLAAIPVLLKEYRTVYFVCLGVVVLAWAVARGHYHHKRGKFASELAEGVKLLAETEGIRDNGDIETIIERGDKWNETVRKSLSGQSESDWRHTPWHNGRPRFDDDEIQRDLVAPLWHKLRFLHTLAGTE